MAGWEGSIWKNILQKSFRFSLAVIWAESPNRGGMPRGLFIIDNVLVPVWFIG